MDWLQRSCGGGRNENDSKQSTRRIFRFLAFVTGSGESNYTVLNGKFIDFALGCPMFVTDFIKDLQDEWNIGVSGTYNYLVSLEDLMDYRKAQGVSNETLRSFSITEIYIKRGKRSLLKKRKAQWSRNLDLESLMAKNSWATLEEMEKVIPFHLPRFKDIVQKSADKITPSDLTFATRFIITFLFLRVKCTRPMTYQYLTVEMFEKSKKDGGFIDQRNFKTEKTFMFDSVLFDDKAIRVLDLYLDHVRPLLKPKCEYLLVTNKGKISKNLAYSMQLLVHEAIGKQINPTRFRQIVETSSSENLSLEEQRIINMDQKHSSNVARVYYQKRLSRDIAEKGKTCMEKLTGDSRKDTNEALINILSDIDTTKKKFDLDFLTPHIDSVNIEGASSSKESPFGVFDEDELMENDSLSKKVENILNENSEKDIEDVKMEEIFPTGKTLIRFSREEDDNLILGIGKYGLHDWAAILNDSDLVFNSVRTRDSLRVRANSNAIKNKLNQNK